MRETRETLTINITWKANGKTRETLTINITWKANERKQGNSYH